MPLSIRPSLNNMPQVDIIRSIRDRGHPDQSACNKHVKSFGYAPQMLAAACDI